MNHYSSTNSPLELGGNDSSFLMYQNIWIDSKMRTDIDEIKGTKQVKSENSNISSLADNINKIGSLLPVVINETDPSLLDLEGVGKTANQTVAFIAFNRYIHTPIAAVKSNYYQKMSSAAKCMIQNLVQNETEYKMWSVTNSGGVCLDD